MTDSQERLKNEGGRRRKVLIVSEYIAPVNAIASIRWSKLSKYLVLDQAYDIDVLTNKKNFGSDSFGEERYSVDKTLLNDASLFSKVFEIEAPAAMRFSTILLNSGSKIYSMLRRSKGGDKDGLDKNGGDSNSGALSGLESLKAKIALQLYGMRSFFMAKARMPRDIDLEAYDAMISSYGPHWTHMVASRIKERHPEIVWLADYRDTPVFSRSSNTNRNRSFARKVTGRADCVLIVDERMAPLLNLPKDQMVETVSNGFDPDEMTSRSRKASSCFDIVYTGALYSDGIASRDLRPVFQCLSDLINEGLIDKNLVRILYAGGSSDVFLSQISSFPELSRKDLGLIGRDEALAVQDGASLLLFSTWFTREFAGGGSTGKLFEYFASGVPIVGTCSGDASDSPCKELIESTRGGVVCEQANFEKDRERLCRFIESKYQEWIQSNLTTSQLDYSRVDEFSHKNLAKKVDAIIDSLTRRSSGEIGYEKKRSR